MPTIFCCFPLVRHYDCFQSYCVNYSSVTTLECQAVALIISVWQTPNSQDQGQRILVSKRLLDPGLFLEVQVPIRHVLYSSSDLTEPRENGVIQSCSSLEHGLESSLTLQPLTGTLGLLTPRLCPPFSPSVSQSLSIDVSVAGTAPNTGLRPCHSIWPHEVSSSAILLFKMGTLR